MKLEHLETARLRIRQFDERDLEHCLRFRRDVFGLDEPRANSQSWLKWTIDSYRELANLGQPPYADYAKALQHGARDNTSIKVPGLGEICARPPRLLPELEFDHVPPLFDMAKDAFGVQRMMWGSDFPPSAGREGYANTLRGVIEHPAFADGDDIEWVMGKTAARVWGF